MIFLPATNNYNRQRTIFTPRFASQPPIKRSDRESFISPVRFIQLMFPDVSTPLFSKNDNEWLTDYENIGATVAAKVPKPLDDDSSDDDVQLNYAKVHFTANPGRQRGRDSSSSDDYDIQYSDIKI